jgi:hypothetical protein
MHNTGKELLVLSTNDRHPPFATSNSLRVLVVMMMINQVKPNNSSVKALAQGPNTTLFAPHSGTYFPVVSQGMYLGGRHPVVRKLLKESVPNYVPVAHRAMASF